MTCSIKAPPYAGREKTRTLLKLVCGSSCPPCAHVIITLMLPRKTRAAQCAGMAKAAHTHFLTTATPELLNALRLARTAHTDFLTTATPAFAPNLQYRTCPFKQCRGPCQRRCITSLVILVTLEPMDYVQTTQASYIPQPCQSNNPKET
jgi:hypothetical protein